MTMPPLPPQGATAWYSWASGVHTRVTTELEGKADADHTHDGDGGGGSTVDSATAAHVIWTGTSWPARPTGYARVIYVGGTDVNPPTDRQTNDGWERDA